MAENKQQFLDLNGLKTFKKNIELNAPYIGDNGNWFVDKKDTGVKAQGPTGAQGEIGL